MEPIKPQEHDDRRRFQRWSLNLPVSVVQHDVSRGIRNEVHGQVRDVSVASVFVTLSGPLVEGLPLSLVLPHDKKSTRLRAQVVRAVETADGLGVALTLDQSTAEKPFARQYTGLLDIQKRHQSPADSVTDLPSPVSVEAVRRNYARLLIGLAGFAVLLGGILGYWWHASVVPKGPSSPVEVVMKAARDSEDAGWSLERMARKEASGDATSPSLSMAAESYRRAVYLYQLASQLDPSLDNVVKHNIEHAGASAKRCTQSPNPS